jgi:hypothetical protein
VRKLAVFILFILVASAVYLPQAHAAPDRQIRTIIDGPKEVLAGVEYDYTVTIEGAPDASKWACEVTVSGTASVNPSNYSSTSSNKLTIHVTAPNTESNFTITVNGTADIGDSTYWNKIDYTVHSVKPKTVKAEIYNSGSVDAKSVKVSLYIDDKYQYSTDVDVKAGETSTVTLKWNPLQFSDGVHTMKIAIDPKSNLTFAGGKTTMVQQIYIGEPQPDHTSLWIALAILFGAGAVFAAYTHARKKKRMPKRKKW